MRKIFGHRGLPNVYEENTFKSLNKALEICDFVETDVRITKDEELVLYHDTTIQTKQIEECTLSDIDELIDIDISEIHLISREQIKGDTNFELKINFQFDQLNNVFLKKIINLTNPEDIVSSFDWETILNNRKSFKSNYGILIDKENQLFECKSMSNLDEKLMFMVEKEIFYSRNFDLPTERCVVWTVNDKDEIDNILNMDVYGVCMGFVNGRLSAALTEEEGPTVQMWDLTTKKVVGEIDIISDEENAPKTGNEAEGCVFDDENNHLLISREGSRGYLKAYESDTLEMIEVVDSRDGNIVGDPEGVAVYKTSNIEGYIILSSQGGNEFNLYDRRSLDFINKFKINAVEDTDGLDVTYEAVEDLFPNGFLVVQDGRNLPKNQNFKIVNMEEVFKKKLNNLGLID